MAESHVRVRLSLCYVNVRVGKEHECIGSRVGSGVVCGNDCELNLYRLSCVGRREICGVDLVTVVVSEVNHSGRVYQGLEAAIILNIGSGVCRFTLGGHPIAYVSACVGDSVNVLRNASVYGDPAERRNLLGFFSEKKRKEVERMADIIIKSLGELKEVVVENLKEGTVLTINLSGKEEEKNDNGSGE